MKTGLLGGAFNPPHNAHLALAASAQAYFGLDEVIFMPTRNAPHKEIRGGWSDNERLLMARMAVCDWEPGQIQAWCISRGLNPGSAMSIYEREYAQNHNPAWLVSSREMDRNSKEKSYTILTVEELLAELPGREIYIIIGADQAAVLNTWKDWKRLADMAVFCVAGRPGRELEDIKREYPFIRAFPFAMTDLSSTRIREQLSRNIIPEKDLPPAVTAYIRNHPSQGLGFQATGAGE